MYSYQVQIKLKKPVDENKETIKLLLNQNKGGRILFPMHLGTLIFLFGDDRSDFVGLSQSETISEICGILTSSNLFFCFNNQLTGLSITLSASVLLFLLKNIIIPQFNFRISSSVLTDSILVFYIFPKPKRFFLFKKDSSK
mgnify:CR=1 FL=1